MSVLSTRLLEAGNDSLTDPQPEAEVKMSKLVSSGRAILELGLHPGKGGRSTTAVASRPLAQL